MTAFSLVSQTVLAERIYQLLAQHNGQPGSDSTTIGLDRLNLVRGRLRSTGNRNI